MCNQCIEMQKKHFERLETQYRFDDLNKYLDIQAPEWEEVDNNKHYAIINNGYGKKELVKLLPSLKDIKLSVK